MRRGGRTTRRKLHAHWRAAGIELYLLNPSPRRRVETDSLPIQVIALTELGMPPAALRRAWYGLDSGDLSVPAQRLVSLVRGGTFAGTRVRYFFRAV